MEKYLRPHQYWMRKNWREEVTENLEYYLDTEEGRKELERLMKEEARVILGRFRRIKEIIWLGKYCRSCKYFSERNGVMRCERFDCRLVKPFYGRPIWLIAVDENGRAELYVGDVDWNRKAIDVSDLVVEKAIEHVNGGLPYPCYAPNEF